MITMSGVIAGGIVLGLALLSTAGATVWYLATRYRGCHRHPKRREIPISKEEIGANR